MKIKGLFWILTALLMITLGLIAYYVLRESSFYVFLLVEFLILLTIIYLIAFYYRIVKPLKIIGDGMDLLREQDFSSRLREVGQTDADRIVTIFNKMMDQLKNERLNLREQNHFLDLLIQASPLGVVILDLDDRLRSVNPAACKIFGLQDTAEIIGRPLTEIDSPLVSELKNVPDYDSMTVRLSDANIYKCTHSSFVDKGFHHRFYLIESLTDEVIKAEKKAYEKVIRMIAHEVNNTTAGITSTLDTLETTFAEQEQMEDVCEVLRVSIERCYSMSNFITNFADVVRIPEPRLRRQELNAVVTSCKRFMETICQNRNIEIKLQLDETSPIVNMDTTLFEQVLVNIIKNSAESIGENGQIYITTTSQPICLQIADTGGGINKETETKLFSPFFSTKPKGQGIGLIFIREVLLMHNCTFSLRTYDDGLTRFNIFFN